jgi:hypothetical protein
MQGQTWVSGKPNFTRLAVAGPDRKLVRGRNPILKNSPTLPAMVKITMVLTTVLGVRRFTAPGNSRRRSPQMVRQFCRLAKRGPSLSSIYKGPYC